MKTPKLTTLLCSGFIAALAAGSQASSHREAPFISGLPQVDGTDFYMFKSYEQGRENYVTFIANYLPLQDAYGGPNYFDLNDKALYQIHIDNDGDAEEDLTFSFNFATQVNNLSLDIAGETVSVPLKNIGQIGPQPEDISAVNVNQTYQLQLISGDRRRGHRTSVSDYNSGEVNFRKPLDNIGNKSIPDYPTYASQHIYDIALPGCEIPGKVFVGQRKEPFFITLGKVFDLVNLNPLGPVDGEQNTLADSNVTSLALELPIDCITNGTDPVIGSWTTASVRQAQIFNTRPNFARKRPPVFTGGPWAQISRLGMPLVNEVVIGLPDKDRFNASEPKNDSQFATYVTNPTFPALLEVLFPGTAVAPTMYPRTDLVAAFLTGVEGLNQPENVKASEMLRLNTAIAATGRAQQNNLGVIAGDTAGYPNGRRPGDDVVDITLRVAMGALIADASIAPNNTAPLTDGVTLDASDFDSVFPYVTTPLAGSAK